ncbi:MAG: hypothetical protein EGR84_11905, partial [Coprococcus catus]|nr:hypothetical protein [Coprococcus catus]
FRANLQNATHFVGVAYPPNKISKTVLKMQAFYSCFLKFCLALNSYILSFILKKLPRKRSDSLFNIDDTNINNAIYGKVHD